MGTTSKKKTTSSTRKSSVKNLASRKSNNKKGTIVKSKKHVPAEAEIRLRAYKIFESRGCEVGRDLDDWLQAEKELKVV